ncbi:MAG TPA: hypothetical protein VK447_14555 [Myxococcaceae bacterium]|nr:hypothetical protein [Myxococcaceae bacterium]
MPGSRRTFRPQPPAPERAAGPWALISGGVGAARWMLLPLGLMALVAVGVHAAADTLDDRLLLVIERADAWLDGLLSGWSATQGWVDAVGPEQRVRAARWLALAWELSVDLVLALPVLAYRAPGEGGAGAKPFRVQPAPMLVLRPLATAAVCLAGACAVARMVEGAFYLSMLDALGPQASPASRGLALAALGGVLLTLGWRAVTGSFQDARDAIEGDSPRAALVRGLWGSALAVPLAVAALLDASPVFSFFR